MSSTRDEVRERVAQLDLPLLPEAVQRVMVAADDPDVEPRALAELIERDVALTGHVLRVANTAGYSMAMRVTSLAQAVSRLGMKTIAEIALIVSCQARVFRATSPAVNREVRDAFAHSFATAQLAREIARTLRASVEEAFLGGLLHDVGRPILTELLAQMGAEAEEREVVVDALHSEVGAAVVDKWRLNPRVVELVRRHHETEACSPLISIVQLADAMAHAALQKEGTLAPAQAHPARVALNLYDDQLEKIWAGAENVRAAVGAMA